VVTRSKSIIGALAYESQTWKRSVALLAKGIVAPEVMISHRLPLQEAEKGFEMAARKEAVKVVFIP
jgi:threonine dehydrogenase-like Zn-dependent dehydrogenase